MPRPREDFSIQKVTLNLFAGEYDRLRELYPRTGAAKIIRDLVHAHLRKVEETIALRQSGSPHLALELESSVGLDDLPEVEAL